MAIYENKFEIGDVVWFQHLGHQYSGWYNLVKLFGLSELSACDKAAKCIIKNYTLHTNEHNKVFVYLLEDDNNNNYLVNDNAIDLYNGQDTEQPCKEVTKTGYIKCDKFTSICEYLTEGKVYSVTNHIQGNPVIVNDMGSESLIAVVGRQCFHTGSVWQYSSEEEYLAQQSLKQQYKTRAKWVKNTGEKPDLPDGTLVKVKLQDGVKANHSVEDWYWGLDILDTDYAITKWKLADDWDKVIDGQAPDIDGATLIDIKWVDGKVFKNYPMRTVVGWYDVKKWRYAKEKKAK